MANQTPKGLLDSLTQLPKGLLDVDMDKGSITLLLIWAV